MPRFLSSCLLVALLAFSAFSLSGCASSARPVEKPDQVVWPPPPLEPRVAWVESISSSKDVTGERGFWRRVADLVLGEQVVRIARPYGIHVDRQRRIMVADPGARVVHIMERATGRYRVVQGTEVGGFLSPVGVTADGGGAGYLTDSAAARVYRFSLDGLKAEPFVAKGLKRPTGIVYSPANGLIYVSDTLAGQVVAFNGQGRESLRFGSPGELPGQFNRPTDLAVDRKGRVVVTDALNCRIQIFSPEGRFIRAFGRPGDVSGTFAKAKGVAVDSRGHLHVCDALFDTVQVFDEQGTLLLSYGARGGGKGELWMPSGIYIDDSDTVYVADTYNNRVQVFQYLNAAAD